MNYCSELLLSLFESLMRNWMNIVHRKKVRETESLKKKIS